MTSEEHHKELLKRIERAERQLLIVIRIWQVFTLIAVLATAYCLLTR